MVSGRLNPTADHFTDVLASNESPAGGVANS
jgi:hypothetical protein